MKQEIQEIENQEQLNTEVNTEEKEEDLMDEQENEKEYEYVVNKINELGLEWTHRSVEYIVYKRGITFNQLRSCLFKYGNDNEVGYNLFKACSYIIQAGLVGSKQVKETDLQLLDLKAEEIIDNFREEVGFIGILHIILINLMEKKHFFMDTRGVKILQHMSSKNLQEDLVNNLMINDLQMKMQQSEAVSMQ